MKQKKIPQRMCIGCQEMKNKKELIRIVRAPDGVISFDPTGKKSGRGAYVCRNEGCFTKAYKEKKIERAFKQAIDASIYEELRGKMPNEE